jgi:hypothetical protein
METQQLTTEQQQLMTLVSKCREEHNPERLLAHMQALKTFMLAHMIQQSTLYHQMSGIVEGDNEGKIIEECAGCMGESREVMRNLHRFLSKYEDCDHLDTMEFRASSSKLLRRFEQSMGRFRDWISRASARLPA